MSAKRRVVVAVAGAGGWGRNHVRNFATLDGAELRYVCDLSAEIRAEVERSYPHTRAVDDFRRVIDDPEVDALVVATPAPTHHALALEALRAGKDVLVEKPLALSTAEARALVAEAEARERIEDVVFATIHYGDRRLAHVHVSWLDPHKTRQLTVVGSRKMAVFDDTSPDEKLKVFDKGAEPPPALSYDEGVRIRTGDIRVPALRMHEPLRRECTSFVESVRTRERPLADGRSGLAVVRALEAGARSLASGGARVEVESS